MEAITGHPSRPPSAPRAGDGSPERGSALSQRFYWAAFLLLLAFEAGALAAHRGMFAAPWFPGALRRFEHFARWYVIAAAAVFVLRRSYFPLLLCVAAFAACVGAVGLQGPAGAAVLFASSLVLGDLLLGSSGGRSEGGDAVDGLLALLLGAAVFMTAIGILAHFSVNYIWLYASLLCAPFLLNPGGAARCVRVVAAAFKPRSWSLSEYAAFSALSFVLVVHLLRVLLPEVQHDALSCHLMLPAEIAARHLWTFDFREHVWAVIPLGADWIYSLAYLPGGEYAARLSNFGFFCVTVALLYWTARRWLEPEAASAVTAAFASMPLLQLETSTLFVENIWVAMIFGALLALDRYRATRQDRYLYLLSALLGAAMAVKVIAMFPVMVIAPIALYELVKTRPSRRALWTLAGMTGIFAMIGLYQYVYAYAVTGNPVFPWMNGLFHSPYFDSARSFDNARYNTSLSWKTLYDATLHTSSYLESMDGGFDFHLLVLLPLSLLFFRRSHPFLAWVSLAASLVTIVSVFHFQSYLRYIYPCLPMFSVLIVMMLAQARSGYRRLYVALCAFIWGAAALNVRSMPASGWVDRDFDLTQVFTPAGREDYVRMYAPQRRAVEYLNARYGRWMRVCYFTDPYFAGLLGEPQNTGWHSYALFSDLLTASNVEDVARIMRAHHISRFIAQRAAEPAGGPAPLLTAFLDRYTTPEFEYGGIYVARWKEDAAGATELLANGDFKSGLADWTVVGNPGHSAAAAAVRVSDRDILVQRVPVDDRTAYQYSITARCEQPQTLERIEVEWRNDRGRLVDVFIAPRSCSDAWTTLSEEVRPPEGAVSGAVFVSGNGPEPVEVRQVSLRESLGS